MLTNEEALLVAVGLERPSGRNRVPRNSLAVPPLATPPVPPCPPCPSNASPAQMCLRGNDAGLSLSNTTPVKLGCSIRLL